MTSWDEDEESGWDPLDAGAAGLPPVLGGGCLARFDLANLNERSGPEFASVSEGEATARLR